MFPAEWGKPFHGHSPSELGESEAQYLEGPLIAILDVMHNTALTCIYVACNSTFAV